MKMTLFGYKMISVADLYRRDWILLVDSYQPSLARLDHVNQVNHLPAR